MADEAIQEVVTEVQQKGKLKFGLQGLNNPTPTWVTWIFRTEFVLNKAAIALMAGMPGITLYQIKMGIWIFTVVDFVTWGLGRFVGVKKTDFEQ